MDRTVVETKKAEEKELSEKLYKKLQGLSVLHPMNEEMRKCFTWDMFLKPNPTAFLQVMHYLFRLFDPVEFKRRFFWPITDKKSEANFRSCTVEYLKHLNEKHHLNWVNIKSYLVVMPGGLKFINFMLEFVSFVVQELIKHREKTIAITNSSECSFKSVVRQSAFLKDCCSGYVDELGTVGAEMREATKNLLKSFTQISNATKIPIAQLLDESFIDAFEVDTMAVCDRQITTPSTSIATLTKPLCNLNEDIEAFQIKQIEHKQNKEKVEKALQSIQKMFSATTIEFADIAKSNALLNVFNELSATIAEQLDANNYYNDSNDFVCKDLRSLQIELSQVEVQITDVHRNCNALAKDANGSGSNSSIDKKQLPTTPQSVNANKKHNPLMLKFVSTPPIKLDPINRAQVRLPLQDGSINTMSSIVNNSFLAPAVPRSARKGPSIDQSCTDLNSSMNRSKIVDPLQLIRSMSKPAKSSTSSMHNLSGLGSKWKQLQASFDFENSESSSLSSPQKKTATTTTATAAAAATTSSSLSSTTTPHCFSSFTPLSSSERTLIERQPTSGTEDNASGNTSLTLLTKKSAAVMKVLDASINVQNLSISPSGRLDPLVVEMTIPHLLVNGRKPEDDDANEMLHIMPVNFDLDLSDCPDADDLLNTSDTVLKDVLF